MPDADGMHCEPIRDENGELFGIARVSGPLTERDREALRALIAAARRLQDERDAADPDAATERARKRAASIARIRERNARLRGDGGVESGVGVPDGEGIP